MKKLVLAVTSLALGLSLVSIIGFTGCESSSDDNGSSAAADLGVFPSSITIVAATATNIQFNATGGSSNYSWRVDKANLGSIVSQGSTAIYTSTTNTGVNFLTVTDTATNSVTASITQN